MKSINSNNFEELDRNKRIKKEFQRIIIFFEELDENKKAVVNPLVQNAAFMRITLDDLQKIISEQGPVEHYQNGANQFGLKQSAALQSYNALVKNYASVIKTISGFLPLSQRVIFSSSQPEEKTEEEILRDREKAEERQKRIKESIDAAVEWQQKNRELEARMKDAKTPEERQRLKEEMRQLKEEYAIAWRMN